MKFWMILFSLSFSLFANDFKLTDEQLESLKKEEAKASQQWLFPKMPQERFKTQKSLGEFETELMSRSEVPRQKKVKKVRGLAGCTMNDTQTQINCPQGDYVLRDTFDSSLSRHNLKNDIDSFNKKFNQVKPKAKGL